jgi:hypothetical protein
MANDNKRQKLAKCEGPRTATPFMPSHLLMLQSLYTKSGNPTSVPGGDEKNDLWLLIQTFLNSRQDLRTSRSRTNLLRGALIGAKEIGTNNNMERKSHFSSEEDETLRTRPRFRQSQPHTQPSHRTYRGGNKQTHHEEGDALDQGSWILITSMLERRSDNAEEKARTEERPIQQLMEHADLELECLKKQLKKQKESANKLLEKAADNTNEPTPSLLSSTGLFGSSRRKRERQSLEETITKEQLSDVLSIVYNKASLWKLLIAELQIYIHD